jgi:hypothetical protein
VEEISAENAQLGAHVHLLESELEAAQAQEGGMGRHLAGTESTEGSPRSGGRQHQHAAPAHEHGAEEAMHASAARQNGSAPEADLVRCAC